MLKTQGVAGAEIHLSMLLPGLALRGFDIHLLNLEDRSATAMSDTYRASLAALADRGVTVHTSKVAHKLDARAVPRIASLITAIRPDVVHTHLMYADLFGAMAARKAGVPLVIASRHHDYSFSFADSIKFRLYYRIANRYHDAQIAISQRVADLIAGEPVRPSSTRLIRYGCEDQAVSKAKARARLEEELGLGSDHVVLGTVARLIAWKGHRYALKALQTLQDDVPNLVWLVIGDGPLRENLERDVREMGLTKHVRFLGYRTDVPALMASLDLLVHPTTGEGFGMIFLEAMIQSTAVLATRVGAAPEIVVDGETGLLVEPRNPDALANGIQQLALNDDMRMSMGARGRQRYEHAFRVDRMVDETVSMYNDVVSSSDG